MSRRWEKFVGKQYRLAARDAPRVTLGRNGTFCMNDKAFDALERPDAVELMYHGNDRVIGLKAIDKQRHNAFLVKDQGNGKYKRISAAAFCAHFRLKFDRTILFEKVGIDTDGTMMLDLNTTVYVTREAR